MTKYIHDEWCDLDKQGKCNCVVSILRDKDMVMEILRTRLERRAQKIERQAEQITKLERSRRSMRKELRGVHKNAKKNKVLAWFTRLIKE